jgi:tetratricopeptide (TPR) repeat protein
VTAFQEAIELDPRFAPPHLNRVGSLIALGRFEQAAAMLEEATAQGVEIASERRLAYLLAFLKGDMAAAERDLAELRRTPQAMWASTLEARSAAFSGRSHDAHELYQRAVHAAIGEQFAELAAQWSMEDAELHAIVGDCDQARREIPAGLGLNRDNYTLERAARSYALCGSAEASRLADELRARFPAATLTLRLQVPLIGAAGAVARRDFARAIEMLDEVKPYDHAPAAEFWPKYLRGQAYLGLKNTQAAAAQFQTIIEHRGEMPASPLYALAHLGAARAAAIGGDKGRARASYDRFFALWKSGDVKRLMDETQRESARLQ